MIFANFFDSNDFLLKIKSGVNNRNMKVLFLCIGSEKIAGDSLGPLVGTLLKEKHKIPFPVIGCEDTPVNGVNISRYRGYIKDCFPTYKIIAIDAALGNKQDVGTIQFRLGGVKAGGAMGAKNQPIGDIAVLGVVGEKGSDCMQTLLNASFDDVLALAEKIADTITEVFCKKQARI